MFCWPLESSDAVNWVVAKSRTFSARVPDLSDRRFPFKYRGSVEFWEVALGGEGLSAQCTKFSLEESKQKKQNEKTFQI